ncbi:helix-turn-helix domain-containing protein [Fictibacillus halophilus]|uniref:helix-turn-helix domain-containing protein n=1 Tax=Fictibacillus halophilus TaxID=1610490 RepID=UPI003640F32F
MLEGEIIKFYRKKRGLSQEQLGKDICTTTHVSKIERGQTKYSAEIIALFSKRLEIDIHKEIESFQTIEKKLHQWHASIIMQRIKEVEKTKKELDQFPLIRSSKHAVLYQLILARYYILHKESAKAIDVINQIQKQAFTMSRYEENLHKHILGIYYLQKYNDFHNENRTIAVEILTSINMDDYQNEELYYHLALAYHWISSKTNAYIYAKKAVEYFKKTNNFFRAIQAESVMLVQIECAADSDFKDKVERYQNLIEDSEALNEVTITAMLYHNLGFEYFKRKDYQNAHTYYEKALKMANKQSSIYLNRLFNFLDNAIDGELITSKRLLKYADEGLSSAKSLKEPLYQHLFNLLIYKIKNQYDLYYDYLEGTALPFFLSNNQFTMIDKFGKQLYQQFMDTKQYEKAAQVSSLFINRI